MRGQLALVVVCAACGEIGTTAALPDAPVAIDGQRLELDAVATEARCDLTQPFGDPVQVGAVNTRQNEVTITLSPDERTAYISRLSGNATELLIASRPTRDDAFGMADSTLLKEVNAVDGNEFGGSPTADGRALYFFRQLVTGAIGTAVATRDLADGEFTAELGVVVDGRKLTDGIAPTISSDGATLYWLSSRENRLHAATRGAASVAEFFGERVITSYALVQQPPVLSPDQLTLYSSVNGVVSVATRATATAEFGRLVPVIDLDVPNADDVPTWISPDGCVFYLSSNLGGAFDLYEMRRPR
jgi:hypothetical protein